MTKPTVFISYSHKDEDWKDRLQSQLGVLQHEGLLEIWDDRRIGAGEDWEKEIEEAMAKANVAILLVSRHFLNSNFILKKEVPHLMERREKEGVHIFPIIAEPCAWKQIQWLARMNLRPKDGKPLSGGNEHQINTDLAAIAEEVAAIIKRAPEDSSDKDQTFFAPEKISLGKLPSSNPELFGREKELKMLNEAWGNPKTNIVSLVAWGGVGKTALVNKWLSGMRDKQYCGAERVYGWSFYSHGASEGKQVSTDFFITSALDFFGDKEPDNGNHWEKAERLANLIKQNRTLLILDGLEPLQNPPGEGQGRIKDPVIKYLLRELANHNTGLCIITTRLEVDDLKQFDGTTLQNIPLEHLSPEAGAILLENLGVEGAPELLKEAVSEFDGHALALILLGGYLKVVYGGDVRQRDKIERLTKEKKNGGHARRVMESYEKWFQGKPELNILRIMGLFDSSAEEGAIEALKTNPPIVGLTSGLTEVSDEDWRYALNNLRELKIFAREDLNKPDTLDCHPLIREHFDEKLKQSNPEGWREAHSRLYEYYKSSANQYPDTLEEMTPLFAAIAHGCEAGLHEEAINLYSRRILRKSEGFITQSLGAYAANLAVLSGFFDKPWNRLVDGLNENDTSFALHEAGFSLHNMGRLTEAVQPMKTVLEIKIELKKWEDAALAARHLSEIYLIMGDLEQSLNYAQNSVELVNRSKDVFKKLVSKANLATVLYHQGNMEDAVIAFRRSESMQKKINGESKFLYSIRGFHFHELLLSQGKYRVVQTQAFQIIKFVRHSSRPLDLVLHNLSLGKAYLFQAQQEGLQDFAQASELLIPAMEGLRRVGGQEFIICGLLARAKLFLASDDFDFSKNDIDEAMTIAERSGMKLYQADCYLEYARLYLIIGEKEDAKTSLFTAKEMIQEMEYHLRDKDVLEIEEQLVKL